MLAQLYFYSYYYELENQAVFVEYLLDFSFKFLPCCELFVPAPAFKHGLKSLVFHQFISLYQF